MPTTSFAIKQWGGIDLWTDPLDVGANGAVELNNVDLDKRGTVRCRDGMTLFNSFAQTSAASNPFYELFGTPDGKVIGATGTTVYGISSAGASLASTTPFTASGGFTNQGDSGGSYTLVASATGANMKIWSSASWLATAFTGTAPTGKWLATTPWDNRCVMCGYSANPSRVQFSTVTAPFDWPSTNWVDVGLNDTETFNNPIVEWGGQIYIFKRSHYFVFYGTGTLSDGSPEFLYKGYRTPFGNGKLYAVVSAPDGVYCLSSLGLYRVNGPSVSLVSRAVNPLLQGTAASPLPWLAPTINAVAVGERLYFSCGTNASATTPTYILAWDGALQTWLLWTKDHSTIGGGADLAVPRVYVSERGTATNPITYLDPAATTDNGTSISWSYKTGKYEPAGGSEVAAPETSLSGSGTVTVAITSDLSDSGQFQAASASATLGTTPAIAEGWPSPIDQQGTWFQTTLSGTGAAAVSEVRHHIIAARGASNAR